MPVNVPTSDEFGELKSSIVAVSVVIETVTAAIEELKAQAEVLNGQITELVSEVSQLSEIVFAEEVPDVPPPPPEPDWSDDFSAGTLDGTKWKARNGTTNGNGDMAINTSRPNNLVFADGNLILRGQKEVYKHPGQTVTKQFTTAYLDTIGKKEFLYGRFEIRAKMPTVSEKSKGMWPAFWLRPSDGGNGEIDILECLGSAKGETEADKVHFSIHHDYLTTAEHISHQSISYRLPSGGSTADWHVYALEWDKDSLVWFVDGVEAYRRDALTTAWFAEVFRKPYNIRLNLQVGGTWAGAPDANTIFPGDYVVDYVKYWAPVA